MAPGTENLVAPGAESSLTSQVIGLGNEALPSCDKVDSSLCLNSCI